MDNATSPIYHFKILVPAAAAGRIIGKGGTTIAQLQKDAGARVKMSKASEFYPGTTERVCLISGPIDGILKINDFFMENFSSTSVKILVPNSTAGMIIGKAGNYIKQIKEDSGAYVQISQKCADMSFPERCVTIVGELDSIRKACAMILSKIVEDVGSAYRDMRSSTNNNNNIKTNDHAASALYSSANSTTTSPFLCSSTSSSSASSNSSSIAAAAASYPTAAVANSAPTITTTTNIGQVCMSPNTFTSSSSSSTPPPTTLATAPSASIISPSVASDMNSAQIIESIKLVLRVSGYGEDAVSEITSAMSTLASYGVLGVGLGLL